MKEISILVVDDSPTIRKLIVNFLSRLGYNTIKAVSNGEEAIVELYDHKTDVLLTDWMMPKMDGLELVRAIKADDNFKDLKILMITTKNLKFDVVMALKAGCNGYLIKPVSLEKLQEKMKILIGDSDVEFFILMDQFHLLYEEAERLMPIDIFKEIDATEALPDTSLPEKIKLRIKSSGEIKEFDVKVGMILINKNIAEEITYENENKVNETFEEKRNRLKEVVMNLFNEVSNGVLHAMDLLIVMLANDQKITDDSSVRINDIVAEVLAEYKDSELPCRLLKFLSIGSKSKIENTSDVFLQKKYRNRVEYLSSKIKELLRARIPAIFRKEYVTINEERIRAKADFFGAATQLSEMKKPSTTGYETASDALSATESKTESLKYKIDEFEKKLTDIDHTVAVELALLKEIGASYSIKNINEIIEIYENEYFKERDNYVDSRRPKGEMSRGIFLNSDESKNDFKKLITKEKVLQGVNPAEYFEECSLMVCGVIKAIKDSEGIVSFISEIFSEIKDENAFLALLLVLGRITNFQKDLSLNPGSEEINFEKVRNGVADLLFNFKKQGKDIQRIYAHAALGQLGLLDKYENEVLWYEDYFKDFKIESEKLSKDPFLYKFKEAYFIGVNKTVGKNTKFFSSQREILRKLIVEQMVLTRKKEDKFSESMFREILLLL